MAKTPPRDSKGRFVSRNKSRRKRRRNTPPRDSKGRFTSYRRNPLGGGVLGLLTQGAMDAGVVLVGKAATRSIPDLANLPKQGAVGLAIQGATAVVLGWAADQWAPKDVGRMVLAGGLSAPLETLVVAYNVPWVSTALSPVSAGETLQAYVSPGASRRVASGGGSGGRRAGTSSYVSPGGSRAGMGDYAAYQYS